MRKIQTTVEKYSTEYGQVFHGRGFKITHQHIKKCTTVEDNAIQSNNGTVFPIMVKKFKSKFWQEFGLLRSLTHSSVNYTPL